MEKMKYPWNLKAVPYDERSGCYINAGSSHGVGFKQPVGHAGNAKSEGVPKTYTHTLGKETLE